MNTALKSVFDSNVVANIMALVPVDNFEIDNLFGFTHVAWGEALHHLRRGARRWLRILCQSAAREVLLVQVAPGLVQRSSLHQDS